MILKREDDYLVTSESVTEGHPDKVCDQISDAILDAYLAQDPKSRVAVETMVLRDFLNVQNPMVMEEIRHAIAMQKALIQTPGFEPEHFYRMDAQLHSIWFGAVKRQTLWEMLQAQQLHYTRFRMLDFTTETDFNRITEEHEELFRLLCEKDEKGLEKALKDHLYYSMKRMRHAIEVEYKDYFKEEPEEGRFVI